MNDVTFNAIVKEQLEHCEALLCSKGIEYDAGFNDRFHSFKVAAELQGKTPLEALAGMMVKHTVSIYDMILADNPNIAKWDEKLTDHINYLLLLRGLVMERHGGLNE